MAAKAPTPAPGLLPMLSSDRKTNFSVRSNVIRTLTERSNITPRAFPVRNRADQHKKILKPIVNKRPNRAWIPSGNSQTAYGGKLAADFKKNSPLLQFPMPKLYKK